MGYYCFALDKPYMADPLFTPTRAPCNPINGFSVASDRSRNGGRRFQLVSISMSNTVEPGTGNIFLLNLDPIAADNFLKFLQKSAFQFLDLVGVFGIRG